MIAALIQIVVIDIVFSVDSIVTAVGMTDEFPIMVVAVVVAVGLMMVASGPLGDFVHRNPTVLMLALSFLLMIGMTLIADGFGFHIERGYIYAAMFFSSLVEALNTLARRKTAESHMTLGSLLFSPRSISPRSRRPVRLAALVARVIAYGLAGVAPFIAGYVVGDMIWLVVAGTGLAALAKAFAGAFTAIKYAGAAYLLYLAWRMATAPVDRGEAPAAGLARACAPSSARCR